MQRLLVGLAALGLMAGCDDSEFNNPVDAELSGEGGYPDVVAIMDSSCVACHSASAPQSGLDLETDPCTAVVGVDAAAYDGQLVVAGDSAASVAWHKMADTGKYGLVMPTNGALDAEIVEIFAAWIDDGAPCE